ncbi:hypothetical protein HQQ92_19075 [Shewanella sp. DC2-4]|uniref:hypothetical protein n=1 Tax=Shewanella sp. DC2-4 TaxID=2739431 RepID=UPI001565839C|nr:hypothetical protein [Shewanella sp. DC2-4]NRD33833.1 hypothetical protein [Shewanella sp. DC2-4]
MDETDWASNMETRERAACVDAVRDAARHKQHSTGNGICIECLEPNEPQRLNELRCISCQQDEDKRQKMRYGKRL